METTSRRKHASIKMRLEIYPHQVTGHACLLTTEDRYTIGKPVSRNEVEFYRTMDDSLGPFVPKFRGVGYVCMEKDKSGQEVFSVVSSENDLECISTQRPRDQRENKRSYRGLQRHEFSQNKEFTMNDWTKDRDQSAATSSVGLNPWVGRVRKVGKKKFEARNGNPMPFLFLENISKNCVNPCVFDIKMGTRIHGDRCPELKVERHLKKNALTTTSKLGLRLTGMQVFSQGEYVCKDKYFGRGLSEDGLRNEIANFFTPNGYVRNDVINRVLQKLTYLKSTILRLDGYRLFGTSLVIIYDGKSSSVLNGKSNLNDSKPQKRDDHYKIVDVRLVDFCHSTHRTMTDHELYHPGHDKGFVFGLNNLIEIICNIKDKNAVIK